MLWTLECTGLLRQAAQVALQQEPLVLFIRQVAVLLLAEPQPTLWGPPLRPLLRACSPAGTAPQHRMPGLLEALLPEQLMHCLEARLEGHLM